eukprot:5228510-Pyramimonas_sp.AAC.1
MVPDFPSQDKRIGAPEMSSRPQQLRGLGCPLHWLDGTGVEEGRFHIYAFCSDSGPGQERVKKILTAEISKFANMFFFLLHVPFTSYFAILAKITHLWRDMGSPIYEAWLKLFGEECALQFARRLPDKCVAG